jgi:DNA-binding CsgD family transcriptional regulator
MILAMAELADELDERLRDEFGGSVFFENDVRGDEVHLAAGQKRVGPSGPRLRWRGWEEKIHRAGSTYANLELLLESLSAINVNAAQLRNILVGVAEAANADDQAEALRLARRLADVLAGVGRLEDAHRLYGLVGESRRQLQGGEDTPQLTQREHAILRVVAQGMTARQVARTLGISARTAENDLARLYRKLGARNRSEVVAIAFQLGLLDEKRHVSP